MWEKINVYDCLYNLNEFFFIEHTDAYNISPSSADRLVTLFFMSRFGNINKEVHNEAMVYFLVDKYFYWLLESNASPLGYEVKTLTTISIRIINRHLISFTVTEPHVIITGIALRNKNRLLDANSEQLCLEQNVMDLNFGLIIISSSVLD